MSNIISSNVPVKLEPCHTYGRHHNEKRLGVKTEPIDIVKDDLNSQNNKLKVLKSEETQSSLALSIKPILTSFIKYSSTQFHKSTQYNHYLQLKVNYKNKITQVNLSKIECKGCCSFQPKLKSNHVVTYSNDLSTGPKIVNTYSLLPVPIVKKSIATQYNRFQESTSKSKQCKSTQCHVIPIIFKSCKGSQVETKVTNQLVQTDHTFGKNPQYHIVYQVQLILNSLKYVSLHYHLKKLVRGEMVMFITPANICGILNNELDPISLTVTDTGKCTLSVIFKPAVLRNIAILGILDEEALRNFLDQLIFESEANNFVICPGLYDYIGDKISRIKSPRLKKLTYPTLRYQAKDCPVIFKRAKPVKFNNFSYRCSFCHSLGISIRRSLTSKKTVSQATKLARLRVDSNYPLSRLSAKDRKIRMKRCQGLRNQLLIKVQKLEALLKEKQETVTKKKKHS